MKTKAITFRVPKELLEYIQKIAKKEKKTISRIMTERVCKSFGVKYIPEQVIIPKHKIRRRSKNEFGRIKKENNL